MGIDVAARIWKPTPRQEVFLSLPDTIFEALYGGAAGGGKSEALMMLPVVRGFLQYPRFKGIIFRRTYPELEKELILRSHDYYPHAGGKYNDQKKRWQFPSGAILQFGYAEHEQDVRKYDTTEYNYMGFDEATSFTEFMYMYLALTRVRSSDSNLPAIVRSGTNPGNIGHSFFRKRFIDPHKDGEVVLKETRNVDGVSRTLLRIFIKSLVTDNEHIINNDPSYTARMAALPEAEKAAKLYGDWYTFEGQVFDDFRDNAERKRFSDEPANAIHVIPSFPIPSYWPRILSVDWGFAANNVCGFYAINPSPSESFPAKIIKYDEMIHKRAKISVWAHDLRERINRRGDTFVDCVLDSGAWSKTGDESTAAEQISKYSGLSFRKSDKDRIGGKLLLQEYLRWRRREVTQTERQYSSEEAARISRRFGPKALREYMALFEKAKVDDYLPKFQIFENCTETIRVIPLCVSAKNNPEDVEEFEGDDAYDETRYGLKACQNYLEFGRSEHQKESMQAEIETELERTGNYTKYFIQMGSLKKRLGKTNVDKFKIKRRIFNR